MAPTCRFCLKDFHGNDSYFGITEEIKEHFESLVQSKFILSTTKKNLICELCMRQLQIASLVKNQFIVNQKHFLAVDDQIKNENSMNNQDIAGTSSGNLQIPVLIDENRVKITEQSIRFDNKNPVETEQVSAAKIGVDKQHPVSLMNSIKPDPLTMMESMKQNSVKQFLLVRPNPGTKNEGDKQVVAPRYQLVTHDPINNIRYRRMTHFESSKPRPRLNFEPFRPRLVTNAPSFRPQVFNNESARLRLIPNIESVRPHIPNFVPVKQPPMPNIALVRHPTPNFEFKERLATQSKQPTKIVDKILLKFEKIDQNLGAKEKILGTGNASKNIKKSNRQRRLTMKALELVKQEEAEFKCPFCPELYDSQKPLGTHLWSQHKIKIFPCQICNKTFFLNQEELNNHINELHQDLMEKNFKCSMCPKAYKTRHTLNRHITVKHPGSKYRCNYNLCHQTFDTFDAMRSHMVSIHPEVKFRDMFNLIAKVEV